MGFPALPEGENLEVALRAAKSFAGKVVDPPLEEIGLIFQDHVRSFRLRRQIALLLKARERLEAAGIEPHTVPLKTVVPLLEGASLEDDPDLQERWVGLLTSAAAASSPSAIPPTFPLILRQLTPPDALVLEAICSAHEEGSYGTTWGVERPALGARLSIDAEDLNATLDNLMGLGLADREPATRGDEQGYLTLTDQQGVRISSLGLRFIRACRGP